MSNIEVKLKYLLERSMVIRRRREGHYHHLIVVIVTAVSEGRSSKYGVGALGRDNEEAQ